MCAYVEKGIIVPNSHSGLGLGAHSQIFLYPLMVGLTTSYTTITHKYDSLLVNGIYYKDVIKTCNTINYTDDYHVIYYYFVKNYGIIKKITSEYNSLVGQWDLHVWELTTSNIKQ